MNGIFVLCVLALLIGVVAGMRAMTAPAAVSWAARLGRFDLSGTWLAFLGYAWTPWILTACALGELITDQLPSTPSRTVSSISGSLGIGLTLQTEEFESGLGVGGEVAEVG